VAPLRLGGLRGKQSTPSVWLGGTGELSAVGERERQGERTRHGARDVFRSGRVANGMILTDALGVFKFATLFKDLHY
jgi:hypothetical protein